MYRCLRTNDEAFTTAEEAEAAIRGCIDPARECRHTIFFLPVNCHWNMTARLFFLGRSQPEPFCEPSVTARVRNTVPTRGRHLLVDVSPDAGLAGDP